MISEPEEEVFSVGSFSRVLDMPNSETFSIPSIGGFVKKYLMKSKVSVDPFARNKRWATYTNDLNPSTAADHHMDAEDYLKMLRASGVRCDLAIIDPPYSPRQVKECYEKLGLPCGIEDTQNGRLYRVTKNALEKVLTDDAVVLSFGWNSAGMGKQRGFEVIELMIVCHGGAHSDTICLAERKLPDRQGRLL